MNISITNQFGDFAVGSLVKIVTAPMSNSLRSATRLTHFGILESVHKEGALDCVNIRIKGDKANLVQSVSGKSKLERIKDQDKIQTIFYQNIISMKAN